MERTLAIIKPDSVKKQVIGKIIDRIEAEGFRIAEMRLVHLGKDEAMAFYAVHKTKGFYADLVAFMSSGDSVVLLLERENAITHWRGVMGATDPAKAAPGTLRREFGFSIERNAVHGSDARETAETEINFFFK
jgi:nucleoside-diphosphate kinase